MEMYQMKIKIKLASQLIFDKFIKLIWGACMQILEVRTDELNHHEHPILSQGAECVTLSKNSSCPLDKS